jgi:phosphatidylinositol kinase/protein kinase (PI-3  family)
LLILVVYCLPLFNDALSFTCFFIDSSIRQTVLGALHEKFDKHLAQAENVRSLFIALNDEVFENRMIAVGLIGRLARHNPAYVMPSLRKALIQLLTELEYSTVLYVFLISEHFDTLTDFSKSKPRRMHATVDVTGKLYAAINQALCPTHASGPVTKSE